MEIPRRRRRLCFYDLCSMFPAEAEKGKHSKGVARPSLPFFMSQPTLAFEQQQVAGTTCLAFVMHASD